MTDLNSVAQDLRDWWQRVGASILNDTGSIDNEDVKNFVGDKCSEWLPSFKDLSLNDQNSALDLAFPCDDVIWCKQ